METSEVISQKSTCPLSETAVVGAAAGLTAGVAMALWAMLTSIWHGVDILAPFEAIGATFMGPNATHATVLMTSFGVLLHAAVSAGLGVLFVALLPQKCSCGYACAAGIGFAIAVLLAMTYVLLPAVNPVMAHTVATTPRSWVIQHALFGAALAVVPAYWRFYREEATDTANTLQLTVDANRQSLVRRDARQGEVLGAHSMAKIPATKRRPLKHVEVLTLERDRTAAGNGGAVLLENTQADRELVIKVHRVNRDSGRERTARHAVSRTLHPGTDRAATTNRIRASGQAVNNEA